MSMIYSLLRVSRAQIDQFRDDPSLIPGAIHIASHLGIGVDAEQSLTELHTAAHPKSEMLGFLEELRNLEASAVRAAKLKLAPAFCLQKEWHVLHFLLTETAEPTDTPEGALFSGEEIGGDMGYGPARLLSPAAASDFADSLDRQSVVNLQTRIDIKAMDEAQVYAAPSPDDVSEPEELRRAIGHYFPRFQKYVAEARANGDGLLLWIS